MNDTMETDATIVASDITAGYGDSEILTDVSMVANSGKIVTLMGPNGAGKSTLLSTIAGTLIPSSGEVRLQGSNITDLSASKRLKRGISIVPQGRSVFTDMSVRENLLMGGYTLESDETDERVEEIFELFPDLHDHANSPAKELSGGQQQMLELGRGLIVEPAVLLVDEPSLGLAPSIVEDIFDTLLTLASQEIAVVMVEQNVYSALEISDRAYVLADGKMQFSGTSDEILSDERLNELYLGK
jgi:branched-chain amino acid transport system ATP-binding protein